MIVERIGVSKNGTRAYKVTFPDGNEHTLWSGYEPEADREEEAIEAFALALWRELNEAKSQIASG